MNNGQLNITSMQTVTQLVTQEPTVPVAVTMAGVEQNGGDFAGMLSGIQSLAKVKAPHNSGQAEQSQVRIGKDQLVLDAAAEDSAVDLLAQLHGSPLITTASEPAASKPGDSEKTEVSTDGVSLDSELSDLTSQMALAAYSQPGRMPEVNIPTPLPVDMLQNVASATEQPAVISVPALRIRAEQTAAEPLQPPSQEPAVMLAKEPIAHPGAGQNQHHQPETVRSTAVDRTQNATTPEASEPPAIFSASPEKIQATQTVAEPVQATQVQTPVTLLATTSTVPALDEHVVPQGTKAADLPAIQAEKPVAVSVAFQSELPSVHPTATVLADNLSAVLVQEAPGDRQRLNSDQQIEKVRTGNEQSVVKEMAPSLQIAASAGESSSGSNTSLDKDSKQGQPDGASDNQMLEQQMAGQLKTEHLRAAALSTKAVPAGPLSQDISEQVMLQVKERLVQHDVKPGSQQITLTLSPDNLGELKINLNLQGQKLSVEILTENRTVRDAIVQHTDALKESLARQNITMESFDVTTGGKGSGNQGQNQSAWRELAKQQQQNWTSPRGYHTAQADLPSGQLAYQRQREDSILDIHY